MKQHPGLRTYLLDLLQELRDTGISPIIGGGYGIFLETEYVRTRGESWVGLSNES